MLTFATERTGVHDAKRAIDGIARGRMEGRATCRKQLKAVLKLSRAAEHLPGHDDVGDCGLL